MLPYHSPGVKQAASCPMESAMTEHRPKPSTLVSRQRWSHIVGPTLLVLGCMMALYAQTDGRDPVLRDVGPASEIIEDLREFIPEFMRRENIPGVSIALIHDGRIAWTEGFGEINAFTGGEVTPDTVFEVASNSKVMAAYLALRLVDQGRLALDEPLHHYLAEPWLPVSIRGDAITLRHVLSHSSGLGHGTLDKDIHFTPGDRYSYSAVGYKYVQAVIEQITGQSLEAAARELVFTPLEMTSTSYINRADLTPRSANGHVRATIPAVLFAMPFVTFALGAFLIALVIRRLWKKTWRPTWRLGQGVMVVAFFLVVAPAFYFLAEMGLPEFAWLIAFTGVALLATLAAAFHGGAWLLGRFGPGPSRRRSAGLAVVTVLVMAGLILLVTTVPNVPVPRWTPVPAEAAGSARATAGDLAALLLELAHPRHLSADRAVELRTSQVRLSDQLSWGLGPGILHSRAGDALWQWGQHIDFQSLMIIYPDRDFGVVVLTNNDLLRPETAIRIAHRALGGEIGPILRASRLEFNVRPPS